jgi:hypothetical protein
MKTPLLLKEIEQRTEDIFEKDIITKILEAEESSLRKLPKLSSIVANKLTKLFPSCKISWDVNYIISLELNISLGAVSNFQHELFPRGLYLLFEENKCHL